MGIPVVTKASGGMPIVSVASGRGTPVSEAANGWGIAVTVAANGFGLPVVYDGISKNIVTDYGCPTNGTSDCRPAFIAFRDAHQGKNVTLTLPAGTYNFHATGVADHHRIFKGISTLVVEGAGATITDNGNTGVIVLGGLSQFQDNVHSTRLVTVAAGATSVTVNPAAASQPGGTALDTIAECCALFAVGRYALITGYDLQGFYNAPGGFPSNAHFFEYVRVTNINSGTGVITFDAPLVNGYLSTWPRFNSGSAFEIDTGGPATLYALDPSWDTDVEIRGITFNIATAQTYAGGRSITYRNCTFTGTKGAIPTSNRLWQAIDCNFAAADMEVDKFVTSMVMTRTSSDTVGFQSSSVDALTLDDCDITLLLGTPKRAVISNSRIGQFVPGAYAYGRSDTLTVTNSVINTILPGGIVEKGPADAGVNTNGMTMAGGVITIPNSILTGTYFVNFCRTFVPGSNVFWSNQSQRADKLFRVLGVTQDATNCYIQTSEAGGFPTPVDGAGKLYLRVHPAPVCTFTGCTGTDGVAASLSQAPAGRPIFSYQKFTYPGAIGAAEQLKFTVWGLLSSVSINVTQAYGGGLTPNFSAGQGWTMSGSAETQILWYPEVNAKIAGNRVVTHAGVTGTQTGDGGLAVPDAVRSWFTASIAFAGPKYSVDTSAGTPAPSITVTFQTEQGVVVP